MLAKLKTCLLKNPYLFYSISFLIFIPFIMLPFLLKGNGLIAICDGYNELFPVFYYRGRIVRECIEAIVSGRQVPQYDFSIIFGSDITKVTALHGLGSLSYWLAIVFPLKAATYAYSVTILLDWYLSGIFTVYYLRTRGIGNVRALVVGAISYVFGNYVIYYGFQMPLFLDMFTFFPLALSGVEKIANDRKKKILSLPILITFTFMAFISFYYVYIIGILVIIYSLIVLFCRIKTIKDVIIRGSKICLNAFCGTLLGAPILLPSVLALIESDRISESSGLSIFYPLKIYCEKVSTFIFKDTYSSGIGVLPITLIALTFIFICRNSISKDYRELRIFACVGLFGYISPFFESMMNGFGYSIDRWSFFLTFVLSVILATYFDDTEKDEVIHNKKKYMCLWYILLFAITSGTFWMIHNVSRTSVLQFIYYLVIWLVYWFYLYRYNNKNNYIYRNIELITIVFAGATIILASAPVSMGGGGLSAGFKKNEMLMEDYLKYQGTDTKEGGFFARTDIYNTSLDWPIVANTHSTTGYYSTIDAKYTEFYRKYMISSAINGGSFGTVGLEDRSVLQQLLAVVSYLDYNGNIIDADYDTGMGFLYDGYVLSEEANNLSALEKMVLLKNTVTLNCDDEICYKLKDDIIAEHKSADLDICEIPIELSTGSFELDSDNIIDTKENISILYDKEFTKENEVYVLVTELTAESDDTKVGIGDRQITLRSENFRGYLEGHNDFLVHVTDEIANTGRIDIEFPPGKYHLGSVSLFTVKKSAINAKIVDFNYDVNRIYANFDTDDDKVLFISVPYSEDWTWEIDGQEVDAYVTDYLFTGIFVSKGKHHIEGHYKASYGVWSLCLLGISCVVLIGMVLVDSHNVNRRDYNE